MASQPTSEHAPHADASAEISHLQAEKLREEIRELRYRWWQRPAWIAPVATVIIAALGLIWAASSGFFDVSRRELELKKQQLIEETRQIQLARDAQSRKFEAERREYLDRLEKLRQELDNVDRPFILDGSLLRAPWDKQVSAAPPLIELVGANFGTSAGGVNVVPLIHCPGFELQVVDTMLSDVEVTSWSVDTINISLSESALGQLAQLVAASLPEIPHKRASDCTVTLSTSLTRADGKTSGAKELSLTGGTLWLLGNQP